MKTFRFLALIICLVLVQKDMGWAQVNIQVGYGISILDPESNQALLSDYLIENEWLTKGDIHLNVLHGIDFGLKHTWSGFAMGLIWRNRGSKMEFEGISPQTNSQLKEEIFYRMNAYSLFLETNARFIGFGASIDWNDLGIKRRYSGIDQKMNILDQSQWANRFYLNLNFPAGNTSRITLQLSYQLPLWEYDVNPLANSLLNKTNASYPKEKWKHFGLSLLINNGPQN